jgi:hypothetical protein
MALKVELAGRSLPSKFEMQYLTKGLVGRYVSVPFTIANEPKISSAYCCIHENLPEDQCIFIRGFRVARTLGILPKHLRAAAKPSTDTDGDDWDSGPEVRLISIPTVSKVSYLVSVFKY